MNYLRGEKSVHLTCMSLKNSNLMQQQCSGVGLISKSAHPAVMSAAYMKGIPIPEPSSKVFKSVGPDCIIISLSTLF